MAVSTYFNRVKYTPVSAGTVDFVTSVAVTGFLTPATAGITNGAIVSYVAFNSTQTEWETGQGTYTSGTTTLARTTVRESSNAGAKVNFTAAPTVALDLQAQDITNLPPLAINGATLGSNALAVTGTSAFSTDITISTGLMAFSLGQSATSSTYSVPTFRAKTANTPTAFDIMPNGTGNSGGNIAWIDVCDTDVYASGSNVMCGRIAATNGDIQIGAIKFGSPTERNLNIISPSTVKFTLAAANRLDYGISTASRWTFLGAADIVPATPGTAITLTSGTVTSSLPFYNATQTWNSGGVTFLGEVINITDTASSGLSGAFEVQYGGAGNTYFRIGKGTAGYAALWLGAGITPSLTNFTIAVTGSQSYFQGATSGGIALLGNTSSYLGAGTHTTIGNAVGIFGVPLGFNSGAIAGALDATISRNAAGIIQFGTTAANALGSIMAVAGTFTGRLTNLGGAAFIATNTALTDGVGASAGTITNAPSIGNPTKWIGINDNGTTRYIPAW